MYIQYVPYIYFVACGVVVREEFNSRNEWFVWCRRFVPFAAPRKYFLDLDAFFSLLLSLKPIHHHQSSIIRVVSFFQRRATILLSDTRDQHSLQE